MHGQPDVLPVVERDHGQRGRSAGGIGLRPTGRGGVGRLNIGIGRDEQLDVPDDDVDLQRRGAGGRVDLLRALVSGWHISTDILAIANHEFYLLVILGMDGHGDVEF